MLDEIRILESMALFKKLTPNDLEKIVNILHPVNVKKGEVLTKENQSAEYFYIILSGKFSLSANGKEAIVLEKKGDFIGWATIIAAPKYIGTAEALTDGEVFKMARDDFMDLLISDAHIGNIIMANGSALTLKGKPFIQD